MNPSTSPENALRMNACRVHRFGAPEVIVCEEIERPVPGPREVLVRVGAAGVGPWDAWIRAGKSVLPQPLPLTLGSDLSGVVVAVGAEVTDFEAGTEVFGVTNARFTGAYAEFARADAGMIARKPRSLGHVAAASVPVVAVTAWQMLFERANLARGQRVLVHGGGGSVGSCAVQMAHAKGAHVIATASARDIEYVRGLGADEVLDYHVTPFDRMVAPVDVVIDTVGGDTLQRSLGIIARGGVLVSAVSDPDAQEAAQRGVRASFILVNVTAERLARIAESIDAGELSVRVGTELPLDAAREAHEMLEGTRAHASGKIVLKIDA